MFRIAAALIASISLSGVPALAADNDVERASATASAETVSTGGPMAGDVDWSMKPLHVGSGMKRPAVLAGLYASLAGLQVYDAASTARGLKQGAREGNPLMQGAAHNAAMFWSIKAATTALPMMLADRMWKRNKAGAIVMMALANSVAATVAVNNAHVLRSGR